MKNAIEGFVQGVHTRIDRTAFPGLSGGTQSQLLTGLKFLGLITDDGKPTQALHALAVPDEAARKKRLEEILRVKYADLFALDLLKTTPALLEEKMGESYNVTGSTRDRALRFFLSAIDYLDIPVSPLLKKVAGNGSSVARRRRVGGPRPKNTDEGSTPSTTPASSRASGGTVRTITFKNGDTLTLSASIDLFTLPDDDRAFVLDLIDRMKRHEQEGGETA
jgi:hypothetical protein